MHSNLILVTGFLFAFNIFLVAQQSKFKVEYIAEHSFLHCDVYNGKNILNFDSNHSLFTHENYPLENKGVVGGYLNQEFIGDYEKSPVFVHLRNKKIYTKKTNGPIHGSLHILTEELGVINWRIGEDTKEIGGYNTRVAYTNYEGRSYEAWFAEDIPYPFGPYRLHGLPGLILEAYSTDGFVKWSFQSFEELADSKVLLSPPSNGVPLSWEEYVEKSLGFKKKFEGTFTTSSGGTITKAVLDDDPNQEIEKGKFCIFERFRSGELNLKN